MLQLPLFEPVTNWVAPNLATLPEWDRVARVCIDAETYDPQLRELGIGVRRGGYTIGWSITLADKAGVIGPSVYLPFRHEGGDNLPMEGVLGYLKAQSKKFKGEIVGARLDYDLDYALEDGMTFPGVRYFRDIQIADPLLYELHNSYSLENVGKRVGISSKDEAGLMRACMEYGLYKKNTWKANMWRLPARHVAEYAIRDSQSPLEILKIQEVALEEQGLREAFDQESELLPILVEIRRRGVRIDFDRLEQVEAWTIKEQNDALRLVTNATGHDIGFDNLYKPDAIEPALREIGYPLSKTPTGQWSIENDALGQFGHPVSIAIRRARKVSLLRNTFANSMRRYECNGRIHCTYNQIARENEAGDQKGVRYGRLSAVHPNFQQQPSPDKDQDIAGEWRKIFIPEQGKIWGCLDYKQQEPKWTTHFAAITNCTGAEEAAKQYREDPDIDNHDLMVKMIHGLSEFDRMLRDDPKEFKTVRNASKQIFLGLCYGEGGAKLCRGLHLPTRWSISVGSWGNRETTYFEHEYQAYNERARLGDGYVMEAAGEEGQTIIDKFDKAVPYVKEVAKVAMSQAKKNGFIRTPMGRRMHFLEKDGGGYEWIHKALNRLIQGTGAEQTKQAMIDTYRAGHYIQIQVHDELDGSFESVEEIKEAALVMESARNSKIVPHKVDSEYGPSWGELKDVNTS